MLINKIKKEKTSKFINPFSFICIEQKLFPCYVKQQILGAIIYLPNSRTEHVAQLKAIS